MKKKINIISSPVNLIKDFRRAIPLLVNETKLILQNTLYLARSKRNLLSFKDIRLNEYHINILNENNAEYLCIIKNVFEMKYILEKLPAFSSRLYYIVISMIKSYIMMNQKFIDRKIFML